MTDLKGHAEEVRSVVVNPVPKPLTDGNLASVRRPFERSDHDHQQQQVASGGKDGTVRLWELNIRKRRISNSPKVTVLKLEPAQQVWRLVYSSDGKMLAAGGSEGCVCIWDTKSHKLLHTFRPHESYVKSLQFTDRDTKLITSGWQRHNGPTEFRILNLKQSKAGSRGEMLRPAVKGNWHSGVAIHNDVMHVGSSHGVLLFDNLKSRATSFAIQAQEALPADEQEVSEDEALDLVCLALSPDGKLLATGSDDSSIRLWNTKTGERLAILDEHTAAVNSLQFYRHKSRSKLPRDYFDPNELRLVSSGSDGYLRVWLIDEILAHAPQPVPSTPIPYCQIISDTHADPSSLPAAGVALLEPSVPIVAVKSGKSSENNDKQSPASPQSPHSGLAVAIIVLAGLSLLLTLNSRRRRRGQSEMVV